jgi:hypothetical protein
MAPGHERSVHDTTKGNDQRNRPRERTKETMTAQRADKDEVSGNYVPPVRWHVKMNLETFSGEVPRLVALTTDD